MADSYGGGYDSGYTTDAPTHPGRTVVVKAEPRTVTVDPESRAITVEAA